jgi:Fis family transcriptional regulator
MRAPTLARSPLRAWCEGLARPLDLEPIFSLLGHSLFDVERALILATLEQCAWNRTHAAKQLGLSVRTMRNKIAGCIVEGIAIPIGEGKPRTQVREQRERKLNRKDQWDECRGGAR